MPELPEVETLKRELGPKLQGKKIIAVKVLNAKTVAPLSGKKFVALLIGKKIAGVRRLAKMVIIDLVGPNALVFHLKMTGQLIYFSQKGKISGGGHPEDPCKYTRIIFEFSDQAKLFFNDLRKFGWARLADDQKISALNEATGIDALSPHFTASKLTNLLSNYPRRPIKQILMDQKLIAGIGNIYADEACFRAKILPTRRAGKISKIEVGRLVSSIKKVLRLSISKHGTSARNYVRSTGEVGGFVPYLKVYDHAGEPCKTCKTKIKKIRLNGRGTHYCPKCQK